MTKDIDKLIRALTNSVKAVKESKKDTQLNRDLKDDLISLSNYLAKNVEEINKEQKRNINEVINSVDELASEKNRFGKSLREELTGLTQEIRDIFYNSGLNEEKKKENVTSVNEKRVQDKQSLTSSVKDKIGVSKVINKTRDDDKNGWDVLMKGLVSKLDSMSTDILNRMSKVRNDLHDKIVTVDSSIASFSKKVEQKLDESTKLTVTSTQSIKSDIDRVSKSIPNDLLKKGDFSFELDNKFKELDSLKEVAEELESIPANNKFIRSELSNINEKLDNISAPAASNQSSVKVPGEVQAVEDLATYMRDGVAQFENMSRLYVSKMSDLENLDKIKEKHQAEILKAEKASAEQGQLEAKVSLAKEIAEKFPTEFKAITSIFDSVMTEKYATGEIIHVTNDNKNQMMPYFSTELELAEYEVITPAVLIDGDIIFKADVKEVPQRVAETDNSLPESAADIASENDVELVTKED